MKRFIAIAAVLITFLLSSLTVLAQTQSREDVLREINAKRAELAQLEKTFLSPSEEDRMLYAEFLRRPDTGLIRLLPREKYDSDVYKQAQKSVVLRGGGAYYSFTRLTHEYGYGSDISLDTGQLLVGFAGADYGFLTNLGDVPIENVGLDSPAVALFAAYKAAHEEPVARTEYRKFAQGTEIEGLSVKTHLPLRANSSYLLRSIDYGDSDVLVAFRVVRIDTDGSAILVWKLLKKFSNPSLKQSEPVVVG
jgi:hypothetical protein